MRSHFARYEQFLRVHALFDILSSARAPTDDGTLLRLVKERLGLDSLSTRTLSRDCEFLIACGYPLNRTHLDNPKRNGWFLQCDPARRPFPGEEATILELVAFSVARDLLLPFAGTVLWSGIESLRSKLEARSPSGFLDQIAAARGAFHVATGDGTGLAKHPRMLSAISAAIADGRELDIDVHEDPPSTFRRFRPSTIVIRPPKLFVAGWADHDPDADPMAIDLESIRRVDRLDSSFTQRAIDRTVLARLAAS